MKRLVLVARLLKHRGRVREAIVALGEIEERARASLEAGEELAFLGDYLEALAAGGRGAELERVPVLVGRLRELLAQELGKQPGPAGRRRARETYQRPIESALGALLASAERVGLDTQEGERLLAQAWDLALATRNPELSLQRTATAAPDVAAGLQEKEDGAHALLRQWLVVDAQEAEAAWQQALEDLLDQEVRVLRAPGRPVQSSAQLDNQAFGLTLFLFRDLFPKPRLVALWQAPGSFGLQFLEPAVLESLERAAQGEQGQERPGSTRGFGREGASTALAPPVYELLPEDAGLALERRAPAAEGDPALPAYPLPWYLFPDGFLHSLDFEMLPEGPAEAPRFGQGRAISLCLRSSPPQAVAERVDFRRGWLGLGGIDYPSTFEPLEATAAEVQGIAGQLGRAGHPATWLLGPEANAARLEERLG
ncbi:MAG TPA: hypothetical protein PK413_18045, partial [Thermoanaerobaculia bacterium]|nr:hypothetical protein [Thermoanaerobaculia bacterium]